jgi:hypothetical protein
VIDKKCDDEQGHPGYLAAAERHGVPVRVLARGPAGTRVNAALNVRRRGDIGTKGLGRVSLDGYAEDIKGTLLLLLSHSRWQSLSERISKWHVYGRSERSGTRLYSCDAIGGVPFGCDTAVVFWFSVKWTFSIRR